MDTTWWGDHQDLVWGALIGVLATIVVGWFFWKLTVKPRRLLVGPVEIRRLIDAAFESRGALSVNLDGQELADPHTLTFRVSNAGKADIRRDDLRGRLIRVVIPMTCRIYQAGVSATSPDLTSDHAQIQLCEHNVTDVWFDFLNPGEWFECQFITDPVPQTPVFEVSIRDGKSIIASTPKSYGLMNWLFGRPG